MSTPPSIPTSTTPTSSTHSPSLDTGNSPLETRPNSPLKTPPHKDRFIRHANLMSVLTVFSRIFGLIRDKVCATYLGNRTTEWSAFWMGFQLPNLFRRIFGEGALTAIFVPVYTRVLHERGRDEANRLAAATSSLLLLTLGSLTILGELIVIPLALSDAISPNNRLAAAMIALMLPYCMMVCLVALMGAMATVHEKFTAQSLSPIILNLFMTLAVVIPAWFFTSSLTQRITWVAVAVLLAGVVQVAQMLPTLHRAGIRLLPSRAGGSLGNSPDLREIVRAMLPMILGLSAVQLNTYMDTQIAWWLSPDGHDKHTLFHFLGLQLTTPMEAGAVGILSVAQRLYMLPVGIFGVSMATAIFPQMAKAVTNKDTPELKRLLVAGLRKTLFISLPASIGMILIAKPLILLIYSPKSAAELNHAAVTAAWFCAGIWAFEAQMVILRAFYALSDRLTPMKVAVGMVLLNFSLNLTLVWFLQEGGIALSTTISAIVQSAILLLILRKRLGRLGLASLRASILKSLLASAIMAFAAWDADQILRLLGLAVTAAHHLTGPAHTAHVLAIAFIYLPIVIAAAAAAYALSAWLLSMPELSDLPLPSRLKRLLPKPTKE